MTDDRRVLVTGATAGIGLELSRQLAAKGWSVTLVARSQADLDETMRGLAGSNHEAVAVDLSDREAVAALVNQIETGRFAMLINNAGGTRFGAFASLTDAEVARFFDVNLVAPARLSRAFMANPPSGAVLVNITSVAGTVPMPGNAVYSAAKAGAQMLAECIWWERKDGALRVMEYRPVSVSTGFHEAAGGKPLSRSGAGVTAEAAARDILDRVEGGAQFVQAPMPAGLVFEALRRMLPRRALLALLGRRAARAGYLK
ncbi:MAG: SDR family NAD(P)-dependent oxidoreductase [Gammaproteobacteria bacterium]|nr:SDR family NAD(P)-dependent oxidoreductase [Gammaproteobacteria bacterium]